MKIEFKCKSQFDRNEMLWCNQTLPILSSANWMVLHGNVETPQRGSSTPST